MNSRVKHYAGLFDARSLRERAVIAGSLLIAIVFVWWAYYADPVTRRIERLQAETRDIAGEVDNTRAMVRDIRQQIASGVDREKRIQLARLQRELEAAEERLRIETVELIDPEKMFRLMNELVNRNSGLKLLGLRRREVRPAFASTEGSGEQDPGIYRHVLELEYAGKYLDVLRYMQSLEALDWKLLWDEIEIVSEDPPTVTARVVISTLSARKEWVGI